ncbi:MAG: acyl-homoserine-lactone synthase [Paracoccaceae bacterium]|nr:acyl-homoserine-lactone synthase [Paracoccaceae bacterium]
MRSIVFDMATMHLHGSFFYDFLKLRKLFFVDELGWDIPTDGVVEMDQYDTPLAKYAVVEHEGRVIAGARCQPTDVNWGIYTTMLEDASRGLLVDIPKELFDPTRKGPKFWEGTRLVVSNEVSTVMARTQCLALVIDGLMRTIDAHGGASMITLSPLALERSARLVGLQTQRVSGAYQSGSDGREYAVFESKVARAVDRLRQLGIDPETAAVTPPLYRSAV